MKIGDVVKLHIIRVEGYACWGNSGSLVGFMHLVEWSPIKPIPFSSYPKVGDVILVEVFHIVTEDQANLPLDVTYDGQVHVDFAASRALLERKTMRSHDYDGNVRGEVGGQDTTGNSSPDM